MTFSDSKFEGFDRSQIEEIKERIRIEDVVGRYVKLKPVGKNLFGICPFHKEDTPSFSVNPELNIYKCYGCGEAGDAFHFLEKVENFTFMEALTQLAREAGIDLKLQRKAPEENKVFMRARKAHELAAQFYSYILKEHKLGDAGRDYIKTRKLTAKTQKEFMIGYAPKSLTRQRLLKFLIKKGFTEKEVVNFGLATEKNRTVYDKFIDRLMFSIFDTTGNIIGFSGRIIDKNENRPKYLNSPETIIFQKRKNLFGLFQAKPAIRENNSVVIVEGQIDVLASRQVEVENIVAPLGTGITADQLTRLKRFTNNISIAFDNDTAGQIAGKRLAILAYGLGFNLSVIQIPYGKDTDDCIKKDPELWKKAVKKTTPAVTYFLGKVVDENDPKTLSGKQKIITEIIPIIASIQDEIAREFHIKEVANTLETEEEIVKEYLSKFRNQNSRIRKPENNVPLKNTRTLKPSKISKEKHLLSLLLQHPEHIEWAQSKLGWEKFQEAEAQGLFEIMLKEIQKSKGLNLSNLLLKIPEDLKQTFENLAMKPLWSEEPTINDLKNEISDLIKHINEDKLRAEITSLRRKMAIAESQKDDKLINQLADEINNKISELKTFQ